MRPYHRDYIQYGWGNKFKGKRERDEDRYWITFGRCERDPKSFKEECLNAAKLIYESTEKKIKIHFSGGIDSEVVCRAFLEQNIPFEVVTWVYKDDLNRHDIVYAKEFCKKYDIKQSFIEIDIIDFLYKTQFELKVTKYFVPIWQVNLFFYVGEKIDGCQVCGDNDPRLAHDPLGVASERKPLNILPLPFHTRCYVPPPVLGDETYKIESEYDGGLVYSVFDEMGKEFCKNFFYYTPELMLSYIREPLVQDWLYYIQLDKLPTNRLYPSLDKNKMPCMVTAKERRAINPLPYTVNLKAFIKQKHFPEIGWRPKYTGIEKIRDRWVKELASFEDKYHYNSPGNEIVAIPIDKFIGGLDPK